MKRCAETSSSIALLTVLLGSTGFLGGCCTQSLPCTQSGWWPTKGEEVAIGVAVGAGVGLAVTAAAVHNHNEHTLKGCVSAGSNGLQLLNDKDKKTYSLVGVTAGIKDGERVKLHGEKKEKHKHDPVNREFLVEKTTKDLGPCQLTGDSQTPTAIATEQSQDQKFHGSDLSATRPK